MTPPIRLIAVDIDGTLLNSQFRISEKDRQALRQANQDGIEVILVTGRRHTFALPILLPVETCRDLSRVMQEFRGNMVVTFDKESKGALVLERMDELTSSIRHWLEKNMQFIEFVVPIEKALIADPVQAMFCGTISRMQAAMRMLESDRMKDETTVVRTEYPARDLCIVDVLNRDCSKGHALERWANYRGIRREQVMAIGDNFNDLEMLAFAGVPFIMGNACEELKDRGWPVTLSNDENGVAAAIEQGRSSAHPAQKATVSHS